jgi:hypothetical protein
VVTGGQGHAPPPGYVLIRISDLARLLDSQRPAATGTAAETGPLAALVSLLTARVTGAQVSQAELVDSADTAEVLALMTSMSAGLLRFFPDRGARLLRELGAAAIDRS